MTIKKYYHEHKNKFYWEGAFSFAHIKLIQGLFLVGFALALGANNFQIGVLTAIPLFANLLQMVSAFILEKTGSKKGTAMISLLIGRLLWLPIALIAFGFFQNPMPLFMLILLISSSFSAIGNVSLLSWMKDLVPLRSLAKFWGRRNIYATIGGIIVYFIGSYLLDLYAGIETFGYIFITAIVLGVIALLFLLKVPQRKRKIKAIKGKKLFKRLKIPFKNPDFKPLMWFGIFWGFAVNFCAPFYLVYMMNDLKMSFLLISIILVIDNSARIYGLNVWSKIAYKFGAQPLLMLSSTVSSIVPLMFVFVIPGRIWLIPVVFVIGQFSWAAVELSTGQLLFKGAPRKYDAYYFSAYTSMTGFFSALGPIAGGLLAEFVTRFSIAFPMRLVFLTSFVLRVMCIPLIGGIKEKKKRNVDDIIMKIKELKFVSFFANLYTFADFAAQLVLVPTKQLFMIQRRIAYNGRKSVNKIMNLLSKVGRVKAGSMASIATELEEETDKLEYIDGGELKKEPKKVVRQLEKIKERPTKKNIKKVKEDIEKIEEKLEDAIG